MPLLKRAQILLRPTPRTSPDAWASSNRTYPSSHSRPGPRDPSYTPFLVPFARSFDIIWQQSEFGAIYSTLVLVCGSQMGKTDTVLDIIGWTLDQRPAPIMYVGPSKPFLETEIEPRLQAMLTGAASLKPKLPMGKMPKWRKRVGGVEVRLAYAGSASSLSGMAARIAVVDELDRMDALKSDGDPFALVDARTFSFRDRIRAAISTPLKGTVDIEIDPASGLECWKVMPAEDIESPIWRLWQTGTRHHFAWPCPECHDYFVPRFRQLRWRGWPDHVAPVVGRESAYLECPRCGGIVEESHKDDLNTRGRFVAPGQTVTPEGIVTGALPATTALSMWVSGLCSPMVTFGERAAAYLEAKLSGDQAEIQARMNTGFGELYAPGGGDVPEWQQVAALKRPYRRGTLPDGVVLLTLAVDVQKNRLVYTIRGWGKAGSSWLVDYGELFGATTDSDVWNDLALLLQRPIGGLVIRHAFIDSGFRPGKPLSLPVNRIYDFCRQFRRRVSPTKGRATQDKPLIASSIEVKATGETAPYGLDLIWLDTDHCKSWVHEKLRWEVDKPGAWLLPEDTDDDYCKQIVSEARVKKPNGKPEWVPLSRNNHYLDCEGLQAGLAHLLNVHLIRGTTRAASAPEPDGSARPITPAPPPTPVSSAAPAKPIDNREARRARLRAQATRMFS